MKINFLLVFILIMVTTACTPSKPSTVTVETELPPKTPMPTSSPTATPPPVVMIAFHHLRIEYTSTSDWATLEFQNPESILTMKRVSVSGTPLYADVTLQGFHLSRPLEDLAIEPSVTMVVDLAIDPSRLAEPLVVTSRHGAIGGSGIRVLSLSGGNEIKLQEIDHYWVDNNNLDTSATDFEIDLTTLTPIAVTERQLIHAAPEKMLWAFYYPWIAWDLTAACTDHPATPYEYDDDGLRTEETIARQIDQAQSAGIDGFVVSYLDDDIIVGNIKRMLEVAQEKGFWIAVYLESTPDPTDRSVHPEQVTEWISLAIREFGSHPAYMQLNGKPLVVVYNSAAAPIETWQGILSNVEDRGLQASYIGMSYNLDDLSLFDGLHQYAILDYADLPNVYQSVSSGIHYYSLFDEGNLQKIFAATVQVGFDDCPYHPPETDLLVERNNGDYFRYTFDAAIQSEADWIFITSWNEYGETPHIEPSDFYAEQYLDITREYAERWDQP